MYIHDTKIIDIMRHIILMSMFFKHRYIISNSRFSAVRCFSRKVLTLRKWKLRHYSLFDFQPQNFRQLDIYHFYILGPNLSHFSHKSTLIKNNVKLICRNTKNCYIDRCHIYKYTINYIINYTTKNIFGLKICNSNFVIKNVYLPGARVYH